MRWVNLFNRHAPKPWFNNTIFVVVARTIVPVVPESGKSTLTNTISAIFYNLKQPIKPLIDTSQIDLLPTLFGYLNWNYDTVSYMVRISIRLKEVMNLYRQLSDIRYVEREGFTQIDDDHRSRSI